MYAKVIAEIPQATIYPTSGPVEFGSHWSNSRPENRSYANELDTNFGLLHVDGIEEDQSNSEESERPAWKYRFAWWYDDISKEVNGVVTSGVLYLLGSDGGTIDKA